MYFRGITFAICIYYIYIYTVYYSIIYTLYTHACNYIVYICMIDPEDGNTLTHVASPRWEICWAGLRQRNGGDDLPKGWSEGARNFWIHMERS